MTYPAERKAAVIAKMLPPHNTSLRQLSQEEGISEGTLARWRSEARNRGQLLPDAHAGPEGWTARDKFAAVLETTAMNETELSEYCRRRGLYREQLSAWRTAYLAERNQTPKPYRWKATGEAILEKVRRARTALDNVAT